MHGARWGDQRSQNANRKTRPRRAGRPRRGRKDSGRTKFAPRAHKNRRGLIPPSPNLKEQLTMTIADTSDNRAHKAACAASEATRQVAVDAALALQRAGGSSITAAATIKAAEIA